MLRRSARSTLGIVGLDERGVRKGKDPTLGVSSSGWFVCFRASVRVHVGNMGVGVTGGCLQAGLETSEARSELRPAFRPLTKCHQHARVHPCRERNNDDERPWFLMRV